MIEKALIEFLHKPILACLFGTRDENLQPKVGRAFGVKINVKTDELTFFVPAFFAAKHFHNFQHNGRIAFTACIPVSHETYQFKGQYEKHEQCSDEDHQKIKANMEAWNEFLSQYYGPQAAAEFSSINYNPAVAITFKVEHIFSQTPGPGAGKKIN